MPALPLTRSLRRTAGVAALLAALAGCSSQALDVEGFAAGACSDIAPTLQEVDAALRQVDEEDLEPRAAADGFRDAQEVLQPVVESGDELAEDVQQLVTRLGLFRLAVDAGSYDGEQDADVRTAVDGLAETCRG